jgi:hypothetical protein
MKGYIVCKTGLYNAAKPANIVPKLYQYMGGIVGSFEVKAYAPYPPVVGGWCVCIVDDAAVIPAPVQNDPEIFTFDTEAELDITLANPQRNAVNAQLAQTPYGVTAVAGDTRRAVLGKIRAAVGDSIESWGLGV